MSLRTIMKKPVLCLLCHLAFITLLAARLPGAQVRQVQTLTWKGTTNEFLRLNTPYPLRAISSAGIAITSRIDAGPAVLSNGTITVTGIGTVWVSAEHAGNDVYAPARISRSLNVRRADFSLLGTIDTSGDAYRVQVVGNQAFVAARWGGLQLINVANPPNPVLVGGRTNLHLTSTWDVEVVGDHAYLADDVFGLQILKVTDATNLVPVGNWDSSGYAIEVQVEGDLAFLAVYLEGFRIVNVGDPTRPALVGGFDTPGESLGLQVVGDLAYIADGNAGLQVLNVAEPARPFKLGGFQSQGRSFGVRVIGGYAYVANVVTELQIVDVRHPPDLVQVNEFDTGQGAAGLEVFGSYAFVMAGFGGLLVLDVSNSANPIKVGGFDSTGYAIGVQVLGHRAYLADGHEGLKILDFQLTLPQTLEPPLPLEVPITDQFLMLPSTSISGASVTYTLLDGPATRDDNRLVFTGPGIVRLRAEAPGDENYRPLKDERSIRVFQLPQTLTWAGTTNEVLELDNAYPLSATSSRGLPVTLRVDSGPATLTNGTLVSHQPGIVVVIAEQVGTDIIAPIREFRTFNIRHVYLAPAGGHDTPGFASAVQVVGNYAYVADHDAGLQVFDISEPSHPVRVGSYDTSGSAYDVKVVGNYAYVADYRDDLQIIDISNPSTPSRMGGYNLPDSDPDHEFFDSNSYSVRLQVRDNYAFLALRGFGGLLVVDVSNPANPIRLAESVAQPNPIRDARGVALSGNYAYLVESSYLTGALQVIDVSLPANPTRLASYPMSRFANRVQIFGNLAFIAENFTGLEILDIRVPTSPIRLGGYNSSGQVVEVLVKDNYAYVSDGSAGVLVLNIGDPSNPVVVGGYDTPGSASEIQIVGNFAYVADGQAGLQVLTLEFAYPQHLVEQRLTWRLPTNEVLTLKVPHPLDITASSGLPVSVQVDSGTAVITDGTIIVNALGTVTVTAEQPGSANYKPIRETRSFNVRKPLLRRIGGIATFGPAVAVSVAGNYAVVAADSAGVQVIDISRPASPRLVGTYNAGGIATGAQLRGDFAYLTDGVFGLQILDMTDPRQPRLAAGIDTTGFARGVQLAGNYAYVAHGGTGFAILDVSNPLKPVRIGGFQNQVYARGLYVTRNLAFVADFTAGLRIFDVRNPAQPYQVGAYDTSGTSYAVQVAGNYAYVADYNTGLQIIDIADPSKPVRVGSFDTPDLAVGLQLVGDLAYVADGIAGVRVINVKDPAHPTNFMEYDTVGSALALQVVGDLVYVADGVGGLQILEQRVGYPQSLHFELPTELSFSGAPVSSSAHASSGLPVSLSVISGPAEVVNQQILLRGLGAVVIAVEQTGDEFYLPANVPWTLTVVPPRLGLRPIDGQWELYWPVGVSGLHLQDRESLAPDTPWREQPVAPVMVDGEMRVRLGESAVQRYFRLAKP